MDMGRKSGVCPARNRCNRGADIPEVLWSKPQE